MDSALTLKGLISSSDLLKVEQNILNGFITRLEVIDEKNRIDMQIIEEISNVRSIGEVLYSNDDVKIYKITGEDEWAVKYPYRSIYRDSKTQKWILSSTVSHTFDVAFLVYLQEKHIGSNSDFARLAMRMLEIPLGE